MLNNLENIVKITRDRKNKEKYPKELVKGKAIKN